MGNLFVTIKAGYFYDIEGLGNCLMTYVGEHVVFAKKDGVHHKAMRCQVL
jgi:hypothetical protein